MNCLQLSVTVFSLISFLGCNSGDSSKPGQKSEMELMVEQLEREKSGKPVAASPKKQSGATKSSGKRDYEAFMLAKYREGITPENNAAVLFWQAIWPGEFLEPADYEPIARELGMKQVPSPNSGLKDSQNKENLQHVRDWLRANGQPAATDDDASNYIYNAARRPWTSTSAPPLAEWVQENQAAFDMLVEATKRPKFYAPSPSLLNDVDESILEMLTPGPQMARSAARDLSIRAMWNLGEGRPDKAWSDVLAIYRLGRLVSQGHTIIEQLVGFALEGIARQATLALLEEMELTVEQGNLIKRDLLSLAEFSGMANALDVSERAMLEDISVRFRNRQEGEWVKLLDVHPNVFKLTQVPVDWSLIIRSNNLLYDRAVRIAQMPSGTDRNEALAKLQKEVNAAAEDGLKHFASITKSDDQRRNELMSALMLTLQFPEFTEPLYAQDRANTNLALTRLAAVLAVYRAEHGSYPETLDALVPGEIDKLPVDCFHEKPYVYKPAEDGYTLYSFGRDGQDDDGYGLENPSPTGNAKDADDISIRLPLPKEQ